jgi:peptidoglycan/LPS O-acetylase OafA/YrhL
MTTGIEHVPLLIDFVNGLNSGVQHFFVLSGYVIAAAMDRALLHGHNENLKQELACARPR